jgi:hypothetical protein
MTTTTETNPIELAAYPRVNAYDEAQARRWVADEEREGHRAWIEYRDVTPWKKEKR